MSALAVGSLAKHPEVMEGYRFRSLLEFDLRSREVRGLTALILPYGPMIRQ